MITLSTMYKNPKIITKAKSVETIVGKNKMLLISNHKLVLLLVILFSICQGINCNTSLAQDKDKDAVPVKNTETPIQVQPNNNSTQPVRPLTAIKIQASDNSNNRISQDTITAAGTTDTKINPPQINQLPEGDILATHQLLVQIVKLHETGQRQIFLNGKPVDDPSTAAFIMRLVYPRVRMNAMNRPPNGPEFNNNNNNPDDPTAANNIEQRRNPPPGRDRMMGEADWDNRMMRPGPGQEGGRRGQHDFYRQRQAELTPELVQQIMTVISDFDSPVVLKQLQELQASENKDEFKKQLQALSYKWASELYLIRSNEVAYDLRLKDHQYSNQTLDLQIRYRTALDDGNQELADQLASDLERVVYEHFDIRQKQRELDVEKLALDVEKLREKLKERLAKRDEICKRHLEIQLGQPDEF